MPRQTIFTREDIIRAAYDLVEEKGLHRLTARGVAGKLNSSTAPVYTNFKTMGDLSREVIREGVKLLQHYAISPHTDHVFLNMGVGIIKYARDHRNLFRAMFLETNEYKDILTQLHHDLLPVMDRDESLDTLSWTEKDDLLNKMAIVTHGIAAQVCVGLMELQKDEDITEILVNVGTSVVSAAIADAERKSSHSIKDEESC